MWSEKSANINPIFGIFNETGISLKKSGCDCDVIYFGLKRYVTTSIVNRADPSQSSSNTYSARGFGASQRVHIYPLQCSRRR